MTWFQNLMATGEELNQGPSLWTRLSAGFTDLNGKSLQTSRRRRRWRAAWASPGATWGGFGEMKERRGWLTRGEPLMMCQKVAATSNC